MTPADILTRTAETFGVAPQALAGRTRSAYLAQARQAAMVGLRDLGLSLASIGQLLNRDHTTVLHGLGAAATRAEANPRYAQQLAAVRGDLIR